MQQEKQKIRSDIGKGPYKQNRPNRCDRGRIRIPHADGRRSRRVETHHDIPERLKCFTGQRRVNFCGHHQRGRSWRMTHPSQCSIMKYIADGVSSTSYKAITLGWRTLLSILISLLTRFTSAIVFIRLFSKTWARSQPEKSADNRRRPMSTS